MKPSTEIFPVGGSPVALWAGRLWLAFLLAGIVTLEFRMTPRDALHLGEENLDIAVLVGLPLVILVGLTLIAWLASGVVRLVRHTSAKWEPWLRIGILALVFAGLAAKRSTYVPPNPITPDSEPVYLRIAEMAREELNKLGSDSFLPLDVSAKMAHSQGEMRHASRARLEAVIPAYWPRSMLYVLVENNCVVLARGSGMVGQVGVRIYDRGPVEMHTADELRRNPYLPRQQKIAERLWYFTSD